MQKISFNELINIKNALKSVIDNDREYDFNLIYAFNKNIKKIDNEIEEIQDILPDNTEGLQEFQNAQAELLKKCGANLAPVEGGGMRITNQDEFDEEKFKEDFEVLKEEYKEVLDKQKEVNRKRQEKVDNHVIEIDWFPIEKDYFPKSIKRKELPIEIMDLIKE